MEESKKGFVTTSIEKEKNNFWKNEIGEVDKTLSKPKRQTTNSQTVKKTQDKRTEDNEKIIRVRFP